MYIVTLDGNILHDPMQTNHAIIGGQVTLGTNTTHGFKFTVYPTNPMYASIQKLKSVIEVYDDGELIFRGRPLNDATDFLKGCTVQCEDDLAFFNDSTMPPYDYTGSVTGLLDLYINNHNDQVDAGRRFVLGNVTVTDPNDTIVRSNQEHSKTWEEISQKTFGSSLGGYLMVRHEGGVNYIDYLSDSAYISSQTIELTKNMLDYNKSVKAEDIVTVLIPLGARLLDANGNETNERLTIKSVNGGVEYIEHAAGIAKYGRIVGYQVWDDVTVASNLLSKGTSELNFLVTLGLSISIKAVDLNMIDKSVTKLRHFEYVRIKSQPHDIDELMLIKKQIINLDAPDQNTIEVGVDVQSFTDKQLASDRVIQKINADYITNQKLHNVTSPIHTQISDIIQRADLIELSVTEIKENFVGTNVLLNPVGMLNTANYIFISSPATSHESGTFTSDPSRAAPLYHNIEVNSPAVNVVETDTTAGRGFEFWIECSMISDKILIVPESTYCIRLQSKGTGKIDVKLREYNGDNVIRESSFLNITASTEWMMFEGAIELDVDTTHVRLVYVSTLDVYANDESTVISDVMLTRGFPSDFVLSGADSYLYSKAEFEMLSNQISLKVSQSDYTGNVIASLINQTATTILLQAEKIDLVGKVTAEYLNVNSLSAISANLGNVTGGSLNINDKFIVNENGDLIAINADLTGIFQTTKVYASGAEFYTTIDGRYIKSYIDGKQSLLVNSTLNTNESSNLIISNPTAGSMAFRLGSENFLSAGASDVFIGLSDRTLWIRGNNIGIARPIYIDANGYVRASQ